MSYKGKLLFLLFFFPLVVSGQGEEDPFLWEVSVSPSQTRAGGEISVGVSFQIPPRYHLYKEKTGLHLVGPIEGLEEVRTELSPSIRKRDPFFEKEMEIFENAATVQTVLRTTGDIAPGRNQARLLLTYQGCSDNLCYREMRREIPVSFTVAAEGRMGGGGFWPRLLGAFLGGVLTDFTPCVLPIIPLTLAFIGIRRNGSKARNFNLSLVLILSMALSYAALGVLVASLGKSLGFLFQGVFFSTGVAVLYFVFALALLGWIPFQLPPGIQNRLSRWGGQGFVGAALAGGTVGLLAAPCVGPIIASLLLYVIQTRDLVQGFLLLFAFGLGMGSLFLVAGLFYHSLVGRLQSGLLTLWMKRMLALLMIGVAGYYSYVAFRQVEVKQREIEIPGDSSYWILDPERGFERAREEGKPIFLDFFATWCLPCLEMERKTFSKREVGEFLQKNYIPIKVDCTTEAPSCKEMVDRYGVIGWPTYLILSPEGEFRKSIVGRILGPQDLIKTLVQFIK